MIWPGSMFKPPVSPCCSGYCLFCGGGSVIIDHLCLLLLPLFFLFIFTCFFKQNDKLCLDSEMYYMF